MSFLDTGIQMEINEFRVPVPYDTPPKFWISWPPQIVDLVTQVDEKQLGEVGGRLVPILTKIFTRSADTVYRPLAAQVPPVPNTQALPVS